MIQNPNCQRLKWNTNRVDCVEIYRRRCELKIRCRSSQHLHRAARGHGWRICRSSKESNVEVDKLVLEEELQKIENVIKAENNLKATAIAASLKEAGLLKGFSGGACVPKRSYTLEELRLNKIEPSALLSPDEDYLSKIGYWCRNAYLAGLLSTNLVLHWDYTSTFYLGVFSLMLLSLDKIAYNGGIETLIIDSLGRLLSNSYGKRVSRHEAGHFLIAYLMGVLPSGYTLSSWDALKDSNLLNVQAGTTFCDDQFQSEVASGKLSSSALDQFSCIALAGVAQEFIDFRKSEGGTNDIQQLDFLLRSLGFTQKKADSQVRWAALNTVLLLRRYEGALDKLAAAMSSGASLTECILQIESSIEGD